MSPRILLSVVATNIALAAWAIGWSALVGWQTYLIVQGTTLVAGGAIAAWMLYVQHQYEDTYYREAGEWVFELAALQGSSYLRLPRPLAWVVGNANYHHVHHLSARIPNYRLRQAHEEQAIFARTPVVTLGSSIAALRLKLWDEKTGSLVSYARRGVKRSVRRGAASTLRPWRSSLTRGGVRTSGARTSTAAPRSVTSSSRRSPATRSIRSTPTRT
jgi:omega-6 fatty acid desaturase (delta-12 desaturase)